MAYALEFSNHNHQTKSIITAPTADFELNVTCVLGDLQKSILIGIATDLQDERIAIGVYPPHFLKVYSNSKTPGNGSTQLLVNAEYTFTLRYNSASNLVSVFIDGVFEYNVTAISPASWIPRLNRLMLGRVHNDSANFKLISAEYQSDSDHIRYSPNASDRSNTGEQPVVVDTIGGNNAIGVGFPTDGSAWVNLGGAEEPTVVNDDAALTNEDTPIDIDVLANDTDADSSPSPVASITQGTNGAVIINGNGTVRYTPNQEFNGVDSFTYTNAEGNTGTVTVTVNPVDDPTIAVDDAITTEEDTPVDIDVLTNDTDIDGANSPVASVTQGANGSVLINGNGTVKYTPNANFNGVDSFTYTNVDGNTATVNVTVNSQADLIAGDDDAVTNEDDVLNASLTANDSTTSGGTLTYTRATDASNGTVIVFQDGTYTYTPNTNFNGADSFTYTVNDADSVESLTRTVNITVNPVPDLTANNDNFLTDVNEVLNDTVASNDSTTSGGILTFAKDLDPNNGVVTVNADGTFTYTPELDYSGVDSFSYTVNDADSGESLTRNAYITVGLVTGGNDEIQYPVSVSPITIKTDLVYPIEVKTNA